jgi:hypothetical protein
MLHQSKFWILAKQSRVYIGAANIDSQGSQPDFGTLFYSPLVNHLAVGLLLAAADCQDPFSDLGLLPFCWAIMRRKLLRTCSPAVDGFI